jgi:hypothetical protein
MQVVGMDLDPGPALRRGLSAVAYGSLTRPLSPRSLKPARAVIPGGLYDVVLIRRRKCESQSAGALQIESWQSTAKAACGLQVSTLTIAVALDPVVLNPGITRRTCPVLDADHLHISQHAIPALGWHHHNCSACMAYCFKPARYLSSLPTAPSCTQLTMTLPRALTSCQMGGGRLKVLLRSALCSHQRGGCVQRCLQPAYERPTLPALLTASTTGR